MTGAAATRLIAPLISMFLTAYPAFAAEISGIPRIVDGDTVEIGQTKIRLSGIDAPETDQLCLNAKGGKWACGIAARDTLIKHSNAQPWDCDLTGTDQYGRSLGTCFIEGEDVSAWMVRSGWALSFVRYSHAYDADEDAAREAHAGLWSGAFIAPWDWRHRNKRTIRDHPTVKPKPPRPVDRPAEPFTPLYPKVPEFPTPEPSPVRPQPIPSPRQSGSNSPNQPSPAPTPRLEPIPRPEATPRATSAPQLAATHKPNRGSAILALKRIALLSAALAVGWLLYKTDWREQSRELSPAYKDYMEQIGREVDADWNGPRGEETRAVCRRLAGISDPVKTIIDALHAGYDKETVDRYGDCLQHYMYPIPAKKRAQ
jgi:endonuclease YncB( thermonuclease family)